MTIEFDRRRRRGGFLLVQADERHEAIRKAMHELGAKEQGFNITHEGAKIL